MKWYVVIGKDEIPTEVLKELDSLGYIVSMNLQTGVIYATKTARKRKPKDIALEVAPYVQSDDITIIRSSETIFQTYNFSKEKFLKELAFIEHRPITKASNYIAVKLIGLFARLFKPKFKKIEVDLQNFKHRSIIMYMISEGLSRKRLRKLKNSKEVRNNVK